MPPAISNKPRNPSVTIALPVPSVTLRPNGGRSNRQKHARETREYRKLAASLGWAALQDKKIVDPYQMPVVHINWFAKDKRGWLDPDNIIASLKAAYDGFTDAGVWTDDREMLLLPPLRSIDNSPRVEITVMENVKPAYAQFMEALHR